MKSNSLAFIISIICILQLQQKAAAAPDDPLIKVVIKNAIPDPPPMIIHCFDRQSDTGTGTVKTNETFVYLFTGLNYTTKIFCKIAWQGYLVEHDVVDKYIFQNYCENEPWPHFNICFWQVQKDGFYVSDTVNPQPGQLKKIFDWDHK